jgi:hypothetical protein
MEFHGMDISWGGVSWGGIPWGGIPWGGHFMGWTFHGVDFSSGGISWDGISWGDMGEFHGMALSELGHVSHDCVL